MKSHEERAQSYFHRNKREERQSGKNIYQEFGSRQQRHARGQEEGGTSKKLEPKKLDPQQSSGESEDFSSSGRAFNKKRVREHRNEFRCHARTPA